MTSLESPPRPARRHVQVGGFVRKEVASLLRQPRLLVVLVAGPFIILLLFAAGYDQQQAVLRTEFVGPEGSIYEESIDQFAEGIERYVDNAGYTDDLVGAERRLSRGDIDAVVVFPADPLTDVLAGEQATITVLHNKIDPIQQVAVTVSSKVAVMELNARILEEVVGRIQVSLAPLDEVLTLVDSRSDDLASAIEAGDDDQVAAALDGLRESTRSLDALGTASTGLAEALGTDDDTLASLGELDAAVSQLGASIDDLSTETGTLTSADAAELRNQADEVARIARGAATIDPAVVVRPFTSETASLQREPIRVNDYFAPAAVALLLQHMVLTFAAMSLVTDRALGLFEVFRVGPVDAGRVMTGKYLAFTLVGAIVGAALLAMMVAFLGLPMRGSVTWVAVGIFGLLTASIGFGLLLSLLARSEVQAVQFAMLALLAALFFGGFFLDLDAFSYPVKLLSWALPVTYGIRLLRDVMLRGADPSQFDLAGLAITTVVFGAAAWALLQRRLRTR